MGMDMSWATPLAADPEKPSSSMMSTAEPFGEDKLEQLPHGGPALCSIPQPPSVQEATGLAAGWQRNPFHGLQLAFLVHKTYNDLLFGASCM